MLLDGRPHNPPMQTASTQERVNWTMSDLIKRLYEELGSGDRDGAAEIINAIKILRPPASLINSLDYTLKTYLPQEYHVNTARSADGYYNRNIERRVNEKTPVTSLELCPLISIIIVSFNSSRDLRILLPSLAEQSYKNIEVILVENGDEDNECLLAELITDYVYIKTGRNLGYAQANNIGASRSKGEYLLLLNPDTSLDRHAIKELLYGLTKSSTHSLAASPKIYFFREFIRVWIKNLCPGYFLSRKDAISRLDYTKTFIRQGIASDCGEYIHPDGDGCICFDIPAPQENEFISLTLNRGNDLENRHILDLSRADVYIGNPSEPVGHVLFGSPFNITSNSKIGSIARRLINNASSALDKHGMPYDVGFGDEDKNEYSTFSYANAFCGCCVLLHRLVWIARKLYFPDFFAYFEDTELSHWMSLHHYQVLYCPSSVVYHRHSESTREYSSDWEYLVSRSRTLYKWITSRIADSSYARRILDEQSTEGVSSPLIEAVQELYPTISLTRTQRDQKRSKITVAIYNSYWSTLGGGEKHALDIASLVSQSDSHEVYLVSERDFSAIQLGKYFDVDLSRCLTLRLDEVSELATGFFDIFVNSTYCSKLIPRAAKNFYIVSFPTREIPSELVARYLFLHNSQFTQRWAERYWGKHENIVVNPILGCTVGNSDGRIKPRSIISVGRFNYQGHCKNQHHLIDAFYRAKEMGLLRPDWTLTIAGSVNQNEPSSVSHYIECKNLVRDNSAIIIPNAKREDIENLYHDAFAYLHGTGIDVDSQSFPELCEHFGISVFDAVSHGCIPIIHESGGSVDMLQYASNGMCFNSISGLISCLGRLDDLYAKYNHDAGGGARQSTAMDPRLLIETNRSAIARLFGIQQLP